MTSRNASARLMHVPTLNPYGNIDVAIDVNGTALASEAEPARS
jgi:hypothetical protein